MARSVSGANLSILVRKFFYLVANSFIQGQLPQFRCFSLILERISLFQVHFTLLLGNFPLYEQISLNWWALFPFIVRFT